MPTRREFLARGVACAASVALSSSVPDGAAAAGSAASPAPADELIIDTHQHLWDLSKFDLAWLKTADNVYQQSYRTQEYLAATKGLNVKAVYMEVDVDPAQRAAEAEYVVALCRDPKNPTVAAVIGGRPDDAGFADYVKRFDATGKIRGVRQVLHSQPPGHCLTDAFVRGVRFLGERNLCFDLCMRPQELPDAATLAERCPATRLVLDHCGNPDPAAARLSSPKSAWRRDIAALAKRPNVICKISGIVARAPEKWSPDHLAPIVTHCLDAFGPDRVVFGSDWPVCLTRATLRQWVDTLTQIIAPRPAQDRRKLWAENARRLYRLEI
jgi:predicted TIM-barrel fold metal-dependent hydrolase